MEKDIYLVDFEKSWQTLQAAFKEGRVCLIKCTYQGTETPVPVICAMNYDGNEYEMVPLATLFTEDPYELLNPPIKGHEEIIDIKKEENGE